MAVPILGVVSRFQWVCLMTWSPFLGAHWVYVFFGEVSVRFFSHFKIWLYLIGIISGTIFLFIFAKLFENKNYRFISILSTGNILTLGFHQFFVNVIQMNFNTDNFFSYALAFIILILFIPLIIICKAYFPFILGIYHSSSNKAYDTQKK